ncbi:DNA repair protein RecO [Chloroflexi bacterium TSY]|nr:DNA repair protein RecO [Chloroflexi bacterium TSY]
MPERQRVYRTHAVVLRRRDQSDADRIVRVFTPNEGKLELIAKGIRKTTSRKAGHLELFTHASLLIAKARTWDIVTEVTTIESYRYIREDLGAIGHAAYCCELLDSFTELDDENQPLWDLLLLALRELDKQVYEQRSGHSQLLTRWYELHLLGAAGFQPQFFYCMGSGEELKPETNYLSIAEGGVFGPEQGRARNDTEPIEPEILKILRYLQSRRWQEVHKLSIRPNTMIRVENILYRIILHILERRLKSVDFLRHIKPS